ncbi:MAG: phenylalanine--tRNA ligase subunit beta [Spirochaetota bacterium]|nr:MAG: phenylalanine--tRNA ligase subunit beta [Spirochaetota bacterium]
MKLSYLLLSQWLDLSDIDPFDVEDRLTMSTAEIEDVKEIGDELEGVVIGKILQVEPHPEADKLWLTKIDVGKEILDIVSGAPNTREETYVPVALIGTQLPNGVRVKKAKLRGKESFGIVCSEMEIGASEDHSGLWLLNEEGIIQKKLVPGERLSSVFPTKDYIIEIDNKSITNRPDLWGHYGFARELGAIFGKAVRPLYPKQQFEKVISSRGTQLLEVDIKDSDLCSRYSAIMLSGIRIEKSPYWIRRRLHTLDIRPINNIVDVTNYVMLETGQPIHAFDADKIYKQHIVVRRALKGETCTTLDGVERKMASTNLMIADPKHAVAIAGVMGGQDSEIGEETERIIIEAANFNAVSVRRTATGLGLRTEASNRFEKSIDPELTASGITGCVSHIQKLLPGAEIVSRMADVYPHKRKKVVIPLNIDWVSTLIGMEIAPKKAVNILRSLHFKVEEVDRKNLRVTVPTFRATKDVSIQQDLVEEIGRIYGYNNIVPVLPNIESVPVRRDRLLFLIRRLKAVFSEELGFTEVFTYSFQDDAILDLFYKDSEQFVKLKNPVSSSLSKMRKSLIPGLFSIIDKNLAYMNELNVFEIGSVFETIGSNTEPRVSRKKLPLERKTVAAIMFREVSDTPVFFHAKGRLESLFLRLDLSGMEFTPVDFSKVKNKSICIESLGDPGSYHPGRSALIVSGNTCIGAVTELNPKLLRAIGIDFHNYRAAVFELDLSILDELVKKEMGRTRYRKLPKYPEVVLALACVVDETVSVKEVRDFISSYKSDLIEKVELFDIYRGKSLKEGKKNLAFNICYRKRDRTITEKEANTIHEAIAKNIREHGWELR